MEEAHAHSTRGAGQRSAASEQAARAPGQQAAPAPTVGSRPLRGKQAGHQRGGPKRAGEAGQASASSGPVKREQVHPAQQCAGPRAGEAKQAAQAGAKQAVASQQAGQERQEQQAQLHLR